MQLVFVGVKIFSPEKMSSFVKENSILQKGSSSAILMCLDGVVWGWRSLRNCGNGVLAVSFCSRMRESGICLRLTHLDVLRLPAHVASLRQRDFLVIFGVRAICVA